MVIVKQFDMAQGSWILESKRCGFNWLWMGKLLSQGLGKGSYAVTWEGHVSAE